MMKTARKFLSVVALASAMLAAPAMASELTVTLSGNFFGNIGGNDFGPTAATFTGVGDTDDLSMDAASGYYFVPLSSFTASADHLYTFTDPIKFFANGSATVGGFAKGDSAADGVTFITFALNPATLTSEDALSSGIPVQFLSGSSGSFASDFGAVTLNNANNLTFNAAVAAVPEPTSWALMIGGFGLAGGAMRRRTSPRFAYAV